MLAAARGAKWVHAGAARQASQRRKPCQSSVMRPTACAPHLRRSPGMHTGMLPDSVRSRPAVGMRGASCSSPLLCPAAPLSPLSAPDRGASCVASEPRLSDATLKADSRRPRVSGDDGHDVVDSSGCACGRLRSALEANPSTTGWLRSCPAGCWNEGVLATPDRRSIRALDGVGRVGKRRLRAGTVAGPARGPLKRDRVRTAEGVECAHRHHRHLGACDIRFA